MLNVIVVAGLFSQSRIRLLVRITKAMGVRGIRSRGIRRACAVRRTFSGSDVSRDRIIAAIDAAFR